MQNHLEQCLKQECGTNRIDIEDISRTPICAMATTFEALTSQAPRDHIIAYHYTDQDCADLIASGQKGIKVSQSGSKGGGVFFSSLNPTQGFDNKDTRMFKDVWEEFRKAQLSRNYGQDLLDVDGESRGDKADCVLVAKNKRNVSPRSLTLTRRIHCTFLGAFMTTTSHTLRS